MASASKDGGRSDGSRLFVDPRMQVPTCEIPRLRYPDEIDRESFERDFVASSKPCIITGLIEDWPAYADGERSWCGSRWERLIGETTVDVGFDPVDSRMMHFGDEAGEPQVLFNPGRLRIPIWAFFEVGRIRQELCRQRRLRGTNRLDLNQHPSLKERLGRELTVQNMPFLAVDEDTPLHFFAPIQCRMCDLVPLAFYLSHDTLTLPGDMQADVAPQAEKLMPDWGKPEASRIWATTGGPWKTPYPPWSADSVPEPGDDDRVYSCFHCDRMENFHSLLAGEKEIVMVPPGQRDVLRSTRFSDQNQWLLGPVTPLGGGPSYLRPTVMTSKSQKECSSDQSAVQPLRSDQVLNRRVSRGAWPDAVDFEVQVGKMQRGDTLYIPAYHWHFVATTTPTTLGVDDSGALAMSVNFWWWPIHNDSSMERWSFQNEVTSWENRRIPTTGEHPPHSKESHAVSFFKLTAAKRAESARRRAWPWTFCSRERVSQPTPEVDPGTIATAVVDEAKNVTYESVD
eukprot:TRINITY_DN5467_c0_g1_i1.p1 TRINITY_DN5467_c0_g1~~TRINITY_DN5467_c0_g1_i1.p1  ORF type:complete len:534 (+),score=72.52 TRINITY_DN5467_c0_g1_i1:67-1602(+)